MWNGNSRSSKAFILAVSMVVIAGCDISAAPQQAPDEVVKNAAPETRYQVDAARNRIWALTAEGVVVFDVLRTQQAAVALPGWVWAGAPYACLPDLALGPRGEAVVTSNVLATLWRIDPDSLAVSVHSLALDSDTDKDVGFTGLVFSPPHGVFFAASEAHGSLWRIDPQLTRAQKIPLSERIPQACGFGLRPRSAQQPLNLLADLCVRTPGGGWSVLFAPDWRSAHVSAAACANHPSPLAGGGLK